MSREFGPCGENISVYGMPVLAPDLTAPTTWDGLAPTTTITGIDASSGLTTVLSLPDASGYITWLNFGSMTAEDYTIKLTIDGAVIWNDVWTVTGSTAQLIGAASTAAKVYDPVAFNNSFLLEIQSTSDNNICATYMRRKLL